ncbi:MAG: hypothetical protein ABI882_03885 [Acidobacteriota bacterium]
MLAIEIPLTIREKGKTDRPSFFTVFLERNGIENDRPVFVREGIVISDVRARRLPGVLSLVVVDDPPLANLLGDCENPAHTQWQKEREHFRTKYTFAPAYIEFVTRSVAELVGYLSGSDQKPDKYLLRDIFPLIGTSNTDGDDAKPEPRKRKKGESATPDPKPEPKKRRFILSKVAGGFTVSAGDALLSSLAGLDIRVAYDRRRGSPLVKYSPNDFKLEEPPIGVTYSGVKVTKQYLNRLTVKLTQPNFKLTLSGFDENRDLFVSIRPTEATE